MDEKKEVKITYKLLNSSRLYDTVTQVYQGARLPTQIGYRVMRIHRALTKEVKIARELMEKILKDTVVFEDERPKYEDNQLVIMEGKKEEYDKAVDEFMKTEVTLEVFPVKLSDLGPAQLTPMQMDELAPVTIDDIG